MDEASAKEAGSQEAVPPDHEVVTLGYLCSSERATAQAGGYPTSSMPWTSSSAER